MFARALIVLLLVLNVGVAAWWATRPEPPIPAARAQPVGVARLQLVRERVDGSPDVTPPAGLEPPAGAAPAAAVASAADTAAPPPSAPDAAPAPAQCVALGPFADEALALAAQARLPPLVVRSSLRRQAQTGGRGWRVYLPPLPSIEEAQATAARIGAAGLDDYLLVRTGDEANSIALGRYGSEQAARRRAAAVQAAGFAAVSAPLGEPSALWLDVEGAAGFDPAAAQRASGATRRRSIECAALR